MRSGRCIHELIEQQALRTPDAVAVSGDREQLTYRELNLQASAIACRLTGLGVRAEVPVALHMQRSPTAIAAVLGVLKSGGYYVPLDPEYPAGRTDYMMRDAGATVVLTDRPGRAGPFSHEAEVVPLDGRPDPVANGGGVDADLGVTALNTAYVIYTSGSTGRPKGVQVCHASVVNLVMWMLSENWFRPTDVVLAVASLSFDMSVADVFPTLCAGARLVVVSREVAVDGPRLRRRLESSGASVMQATPSTWRLLYAAGWQGDPRLRVMCGGEALTSELAERLLRPNGTVWNLYGPTEATVWSTAQLVRPPFDRVPIGGPIADADIRLLDRHLRPAADGSAGELCIGGPGLARGYLNRPDLTADRFVPDPLSGRPGARLYRTGDISRVGPDGGVEFLGRIDQQVKIRGYRVELEEVEATLARHGDVKQVAAAVRKARSGEAQLVAYVVQNPTPAGQTPGTELLARHVDRWGQVFDAAYRDGADREQPSFDTRGWMSSYTGEPIPSEEMREWLDGTIDRARALGPSRVLEIGCGTGMLLLRLAPECERYCGMDVSQAALTGIRRALQTLSVEGPGVTLARRRADELDWAAGQGFDCVILNSVVQYFPGIDYLVDVLTRAVNVVERGAVFVGDVRSLPLLHGFHASVQLHRAQAGFPAEDLLDNVRRAVDQEAELVVDPAFFTALQRQVPRIERVQVQLRRGRSHNEMTKYRYDATLWVGTAEVARASTRRIDWGRDRLSADAVARLLSDGGPEVLVLRGVPNARLASDNALATALVDRADGTTVADLRASVLREGGAGIDPESFWALADVVPYAVQIGWSDSRSDGAYDVVFTRRTSNRSPAIPPVTTTPDGSSSSAVRPWHEYASDPLKSDRGRRLAPVLRRFLAERLPPHMVPSAFVFLDTLLFTPNGKLDRLRLPAPDAERPDLEQSFAAPRGLTEDVVAEIWCQVLGIRQVGVHDNFFELGGHSLLATQVVSRVRDELGVELTVANLFQQPTVADIACSIDSGRRTDRARFPNLVRAPRASAHPLSFAQQRLWFLHQLEPDRPVYNIFEAYRLHGPVDRGALERSLQEIVRRHDVLRTEFSDTGGDPVQVVRPGLSIALSVVDHGGLSARDRAAAVDRLASEEARRPFDLQHGPLIRATLLRLHDTEHVLMLTMHHIVADGWSMAILYRELADLYEAFLAGRSSHLGDLPIQYVDFAHWQRQWLTGETLDAHLRYWRNHLHGAPAVLDLPLDYARPAVMSFRGSDRPFHISHDLTLELNALCVRRGVSLFMLLLAAFAVCLRHVTHSDDILVGTDVANRTHVDIEGLIGFFVNQLVLRIDLSGDPSFDMLLERVSDVALGAYAHQDLPFDRLVRGLNPRRRPDRSPLFQVKLVLQNAPMPSALSTIAIDPVQVDRGISQLDLLFDLNETPSGLEGIAQYSTDIFAPDTIARLIDGYRAVLERVAESTACRLSALDAVLAAGPACQPGTDGGLGREGATPR